MSTINIEALKKLVLDDANTRRMNAGYSGSHDDGGADRIEREVRFYEYGARGVVPPEWQEHAHKLDPEWVEYQRLANKFGGKR